MFKTENNTVTFTIGKAQKWAILDRHTFGEDWNGMGQDEDTTETEINGWKKLAKGKRKIQMTVEEWEAIADNMKTGVWLMEEMLGMGDEALESKRERYAYKSAVKWIHKHVGRAKPTLKL